MKLSERTLRELAQIISGGSGVSPPRDNRELIEFFPIEHEGEDEYDLYGEDLPDPVNYAFDKLKEANGTKRMKDIINRAFDFWHKDFDPEIAGRKFNKYLKNDGYVVVGKRYSGSMCGDKYVPGPSYLGVRSIHKGVIDSKKLESMGDEHVLERILKVRERIDNGDFQGAITISYTLVEGFLKLLLEKTETPHSKDKGDIRSLYQALRVPLKLDPASDQINGPLKTILDGFQKIIHGLRETSNKAGDRHSPTYNPAERHAELIVNAAFSLCNYLAASYENWEKSSKNKSI